MKIIPFFIPHEGCSSHCVFCNQNRVSGSIRSPLLPEIERRIDEWTRHSPGQWEVAFFGGSFTALSKEKMAFYLKPAKKAMDSGVVSSIRVSTKPDAIDSGVIRVLREHSVSTVELGIQSTVRSVLLKSRRDYSKKDIENSVAMLVDAGFIVGVQVMPGLPGDSIDTMEETLYDLLALKANMARIYPTLVLRDTALASLYEQNKFSPLTLEEAVYISLWMKGKLEDAGTDVIRVGLLLDEVNSGRESLIAGPYHQAFHSLVKSALFRKMACSLLSECENTPDKLTLLTSPKSLDSMIGHKKENIKFLKKRYPACDIKILKRGAIGPCELTAVIQSAHTEKNLDTNQGRVVSERSLRAFLSSCR